MLSAVVSLSAGPVSTTRFQFDSSGRILVPVRINGKEHAFVLHHERRDRRRHISSADCRRNEGTVSFRYGYAADSGLLDVSRDDTLPIELRGITKAAIVGVARLPREPERAGALLFADGVVSARTLTASWIVFDAPHGRIVLGP